MWLLPRYLVLFCIAASLHQPYSGLAQGLFSTTIRCKWMFNPIRHRAIGLMKGIGITLSSSLFFCLLSLSKRQFIYSSPAFKITSSNQIVSYDHLPSLIHIRALCFHDHQNIMFSCPIGPSQGITLPMERLIHTYVLMYRKFMLCIFRCSCPYAQELPSNVQ